MPLTDMGMLGHAGLLPGMIIQLLLRTAPGAYKNLGRAGSS